MSHRYETNARHTSQRRPKTATVFKFYAFKIRLTDWRFLLTKMQLKAMLAATLNNWVTRRCASIAAYLITNRSVYLLMAMRKNRPGKALQELAISFMQELATQYPHIVMENEPGHQYLRFTRLQDRRILKLLVTCPKPGMVKTELLRWQQKLKNAPYSSVIDYLGGTGPVIVKRLPAKRRCDLIDRHVIA